MLKPKHSARLLALYISILFFNPYYSDLSHFLLSLLVCELPFSLDGLTFGPLAVPKKVRLSWQPTGHLAAVHRMMRDIRLFSSRRFFRHRELRATTDADWAFRLGAQLPASVFFGETLNYLGR